MAEEENDNVLEAVGFRTVRPTDIPACSVIEKSSYPEDEAASKSKLQYRQHHAAPYFRCAVLGEGDEDTVIGFICSTRCRDFEHESMSTHTPNGPLLAVHSVVVQKEYRNKGIATAMLKDYVKEIQEMNDGSMEKLVLLAKKDLLAFYVNCGFQVIRPSAIVHGSEQWYDLELDLFSTGQKPGIPCYIVDAFADVESLGGTGNPAAVVRLNADVNIENEGTLQWMQTVAKEFNLSETAFLWPVVDDDPEGEEERPEKELHYNIRYFTPTTEVPLCGHATLASAAILYQTISMKNKNETSIVFRAREDVLRADITGTSNTRRQTKITMEFPAKPPLELEDDAEKLAVQNILESAFGIPASDILYIGLSEIGDLLIELTLSRFEQIGYAGISFDALLNYNGYTRGVILSCQLPEKEVIADDQSDTGRSIQSDAGKTIDFLSRFFGPKAGINEDPVTGSAHCVLAPYFSEKLQKDRVIGKQTSLRGGVVECLVDAEERRVKMTGYAVSTVTGTLWL